MNALLRKPTELKLLSDVAKPFSVAKADDELIPQRKAMPACTIETILARAETVTPFLKEILHHLPPRRFWGINE